MDADSYANVGGGAEFQAVRAIFAASCGGGGCHANFMAMTEAQFVAQNWAVPSSPDTSKIFCRLKGSTGSCGAKDMPDNGGSLTSAELDRMRAWINTL